jgi:HD-like signal output (HDOD) protein
MEMVEIPTIPEVAARILAASSNDKSSAVELSEIIEGDQAVTARLLRMANSAYYRRSRRVATVKQSVVVLGFESIRLLAIAVTAFDAMSTLDGAPFDVQDFWMHSFGAASSARELERELRTSHPKGLVFTAALLHDLGKWIMAATYGSAYVTSVGRLAEDRSSGKREGMGP